MSDRKLERRVLYAQQGIMHEKGKSRLSPARPNVWKGKETPVLNDDLMQWRSALDDGNLQISPAGEDLYTHHNSYTRVFPPLPISPSMLQEDSTREYFLSALAEKEKNLRDLQARIAFFESNAVKEGAGLAAPDTRQSTSEGLQRLQNPHLLLPSTLQGEETGSGVDPRRSAQPMPGKNPIPKINIPAGCSRVTENGERIRRESYHRPHVWPSPPSGNAKGMGPKSLDSPRYRNLFGAGASK